MCADGVLVALPEFAAHAISSKTTRAHTWLQKGSTMSRRWLIAALVVALAHTAGAAEEPSDPLQGMNRKVQAFNDAADRWVLKPVAKGYNVITPRFVRRSITNFFVNITYPIVFVNQFLQGKWRDGATDTGRFLMNSTVGVGGLFDPATNAGLALHDEDFGQTFARWGFYSGPYLVIPFFGPSTIRDGIGSAAGFAAQPTRYLIDDEKIVYGLNALNAVQIRAGLLSAEQLISGDRYQFFKDAYLQRREYLIKDGQVRDEFLDDEPEE